MRILDKHGVMARLALEHPWKEMRFLLSIILHYFPTQFTIILRKRSR